MSADLTLTPSVAPARVAVIGAGMMGADHVRRITERVPGAVVTAVVDADTVRAERAAQDAPGAHAHASLDDALSHEDIDGVLLATPSFAHEDLLLDCIGRGIPVLCEKPLTDASATSQRVVEAEAAGGRRLIQVGFMRRFDPEYAEIQRLVAQGDYGRPLLMHAVHRAPDVSSLPNFTERMLVTDSIVHEIDIVRFLTGQEIAAVTIYKPRPSQKAGTISDPQFVVLETSEGMFVDIEINVHAGYGYEVSSELVLESGTLEQGRAFGLVRRHGGAAGREVPQDFRDRFAVAYELQLAAWAESLRGGAPAGPSAWDGYAAQAACEAALAAQANPGTRIPVTLDVARPSFG